MEGGAKDTQRPDSCSTSHRTGKGWSGTCGTGCKLSSTTNDPVGIEHAVARATRMLEGLGLKPVKELTDGPEVWTWATSAWRDGGTLLIAHLDTPIDTAVAAQPYRRDPEWVYGEGVGSSRAPLVMLEFALRALRRLRKLSRTPLAVLLYTDEGRSALHSAQLIREAAATARRVIVLGPVEGAGDLVTNRRGARRYRLSVEGEPVRPGQRTRRLPVLRWTWGKLDEMTQMTSSKDRLAVEVLDIEPERHPMMAPHRVSATIMVSYFNVEDAERVERRMKEILGQQGAALEADPALGPPADEGTRAGTAAREGDRRGVA